MDHHRPILFLQVQLQIRHVVVIVLVVVAHQLVIIHVTRDFVVVALVMVVVVMRATIVILILTNVILGNIMVCKGTTLNILLHVSHILLVLQGSNQLRLLYFSDYLVYLRFGFTDRGFSRESSCRLSRGC